MTYWRLHEADCGSDYKHTFINGGGKHPYSMPGIRCSDCKETWGGCQILPITCPQNLRDDPLLLGSWPIANEKFNALCGRILESIDPENSERYSLEPGTSFQPLHVKLASLPAVDFLWPALGGPVVSETVKAKFEEAGITGVVFCPVMIDKVGKHAPTDPVPMPESGEPEDILEEASAGNVSRPPKLYEMVITSESKLPKKFVKHQCKSCGRIQTNQKRRLIVYENYVPDSDIFLLGSTLWIIINDKVRQLLQDNQFKNIDIREIAVEHQNP